MGTHWSLRPVSTEDHWAQAPSRMPVWRIGDLPVKEDCGESHAEEEAIDKDCIRCGYCNEVFVYWFECECCPRCGADV